MIVDLPSFMQMAIRLTAVKNFITTGEVVKRAIENAFPKELAEARKIIAERTNA
jgi:hypothetical protein